MEIKHNKYYLNLWEQQKDAGFTKEIVDKIVFQADINDGKCIEAFQTIKDWLEENYKMYQYKDNGVKYGEHELFYWASWDYPERHFTINHNEGLSFEKRNELTNQIVEYLNNNFSEVSGFISLQYKNCMDWNFTNNYIQSLEVDYNYIPYAKLKAIFDFQFTGDWKYLNKENADKLYDIESNFLNHLKDKKVICNGIKGTVKRMQNGVYGLFKPRATKTYYPIGLGKIKTLEIF